jgi:hypothetical protein
MVTSRRALLGLAACLGLASSALAQGGNGEGPTLTTKGKTGKYQLATTIDFRKAFGLPFEGLATLGGRIEQARQHSDPVCLAVLSRELEAAEEASGKTAGLTSDALEREAVELAEARASSPELRAIRVLIDDESAKKKLGALAAKATDFEKEQSEKARSGERSRGITGSVFVVNHADEVVQITVNGFVRGYVPAGQTMAFFVGDSVFGRTQLKGIGLDGGFYARQVENPQQGGNFTWVIEE